VEDVRWNWVVYAWQALGAWRLALFLAVPGARLDIIESSCIGYFVHFGAPTSLG
jgi:hypothetical protein